MSVDSAMLVDNLLTVDIALSGGYLLDVEKDNQCKSVVVVDAVLALEQV